MRSTWRREGSSNSMDANMKPTFGAAVSPLFVIRLSSSAGLPTTLLSMALWDSTSSPRTAQSLHTRGIFRRLLTSSLERDSYHGQ